MSEAVIIQPHAIVNQEECDQFAREVRRAIDGGATNLIVDCSRVKYMNSRALGVLLEAYMELVNMDGRVQVVAPDRAVRLGLEAVGLLALIEVSRSIEDALAAVKSAGSGAENEV